MNYDREIKKVLDEMDKTYKTHVGKGAIPENKVANEFAKFTSQKGNGEPLISTPPRYKQPKELPQVSFAKSKTFVC